MIVFYVSANILGSSGNIELLSNGIPYVNIEDAMSYVTYIKYNYKVSKLWVDEFRNSVFYQRILEIEG